MLKLVYLFPVALLALAACSDSKSNNAQASRDPVVADAVNDPIMADPDLAAQSRGGSALTGGGPASAQIPGFKNTPEEKAAALNAAAALFGGKIDPAPVAQQTKEKSQLAGAETVMATAEASGLGRGACLNSFQFSAIWAARLPAMLPIYPRGHTMVAGGSDAPGCKLRSIRFVTVVAVSDVVDFYSASAAKAKLPVQRRREGADEVVAGTSGKQGYGVYARQRADGLTEVDLITSEL
ncbi:MAG: hypothetical protein ABL914_06500 [Novosphingobium sp.]|uniref:hypothetical protein n=1 Tax=Novosphingobium sp. TaxID=1874826 RepID=UPI0032BD7321